MVCGFVSRRMWARSSAPSGAGDGVDDFSRRSIYRWMLRRAWIAASSSGHVGDLDIRLLGRRCAASAGDSGPLLKRIVAMPSALAGAMSLSSRSPTRMQSAGATPSARAHEHEELADPGALQPLALGRAGDDGRASGPPRAASAAGRRCRAAAGRHRGCRSCPHPLAHPLDRARVPPHNVSIMWA